MLTSKIIIKCDTDIPLKFFPLSKENVKLLTCFGKSPGRFCLIYLCNKNSLQNEILKILLS